MNKYHMHCNVVTSYVTVHSSCSLRFVFIVYTLQCMSLRLAAPFSGLLSLTVRVFITHCVPFVLLSSPRVPFVYSARLYDNTVFRPCGMLRSPGRKTDRLQCVSACCYVSSWQRTALRPFSMLSLPGMNALFTVRVCMTHNVPSVRHALSGPWTRS